MRVDHQIILRNLRRAMHEHELATIDFKAAEARRIAVDAELDRLKQVDLAE